MFEIANKYWSEGNRQNLSLGIAGLCYKSGISKTATLALVEKLCNENEDRELNQRVGAVVATYAKETDSVAGISTLENIIPTEELKKIAKYYKKFDYENKSEFWIQSEEPNTRYFIYNNDFYKEFKEEKDDDEEGKEVETKIIKICAAFDIKKVYRYEDNKVKYLIEFFDDKYTALLDQLDYQEFEKLLGRPILNTKEFKLLLNTLIKQKPRIRLFSRTGWTEFENKTIFLDKRFNYGSLNLEVDLKSLNHLFVSQENKKNQAQHSTVKKLLKEGKLLGAKIAFAASALFVDNIVASGFTVLETGERASGKTTTSSLAINYFYNSKNSLTSYGTINGIEQLMKKLTNYPVALDEAALNFDDKLQMLIFLTASGRGKTRTNLSFDVKSTELQNVIFMTSEREIQLDRFGAHRRIIHLNIRSIEDYTQLFDIKQLLEIKKLYTGAGLDFVKYVFEKIDKINNNYDTFLDNFTKYNFVVAIEKAVYSLEQFYQIELGELKDKIKEILKRQAEDAERPVYSVFIEKFFEFVVTNKNNFLIKKNEANEENSTEKPRTGKIFGLVDYSKNEIYVLPTVLDDFLRANNFDKNTILETAAAEGRLIYSNSGSKKTMTKNKRLPGFKIPTKTYCFSFTDEEVAFIEYDPNKTADEAAQDFF